MLIPPDCSAIHTQTLASLSRNDVEVSVLRLDLIHTEISGNKWFKLRYYLEEAITTGKPLLTFGGAWSNHILACAAAAQLHKIPVSAIIRGEEPRVWSATLQKARQYGMHLHFVSREDYRQKIVPAPLEPKDFMIIPEGGFGEPGFLGAADIRNYMDKSFTHCCCAVGTGTMLAGLIRSGNTEEKFIGINALKGNAETSKKLELVTGNSQSDWEIVEGYHFGGYAKSTKELIGFMNALYESEGLPTDFVYTAKLTYAVSDLITKNYFAPGSRILLVHSGGLQGNDSLPKGTLIF